MIYGMGIYHWRRLRFCLFLLVTDFAILTKFIAVPRYFFLKLPSYFPLKTESNGCFLMTNETMVIMSPWSRHFWSDKGRKYVKYHKVIILIWMIFYDFYFIYKLDVHHFIYRFIIRCTAKVTRYRQFLVNLQRNVQRLQRT